MCLALLWSAQIRLSHTLCVWPWFRTIVAHCAFVSCFAHFFFGQLNIQLNVAIWNCRCDTALFLRLIHSWCVSCRQLPIAHLNETKSPKLNTHNQIREAAAISIDQLQDLYPKKIPFLNINYFQSTNKMSKQILNLLYYSIRSHFLCSTTTYSFLAISTLSFCIAKNIRWINLLSLPGIACKYVQ